MVKIFAEKLKNFTYSRLVPFISSYVVAYTCFVLVFRENPNPYIFFLFWGIFDAIMGFRDLIAERLFAKNVEKSKENPDTLLDKYFLQSLISVAVICGIILICLKLL